MFLHLSISHSVHMGEAWPRGVPGPGGSAPGGCLVPGGVCSWGAGGSAPRGVQTPSPQTATVADGTHPTGMHSCLPKNIAF